MYSSSERLGMIFPVVAGCLSAVAVSYILLLAVLRWLRCSTFSFGGSNRRGTDLIDNTNGIFLNLMLADLIQALGNLPTIKWIVDGAITEGRLCTGQAVVTQVGMISRAVTVFYYRSLAIIVHVLRVIVHRRRAPEHFSKLMIFMIWFLTALIIGIHSVIHIKKRYYENAGYSCWIKSEFAVDLAAIIWAILAVGLIFNIFFIIFIVMRGWKHGTRQPTEVGISGEEEESKAIAKTMLLYHLVESVCIFPNTLTPVFKFPYQLNLFISALFSFSGIFNSLIFFLAQLGLIFSPSNSQTETDPQIQWHRRHEKSASWQGSNYISTRRPTASECITSDLGGNHSSQFQAYNSRMLPEAGPSLIRNSDSASGVPSDIQ